MEIFKNCFLLISEHSIIFGILLLSSYIFSIDSLNRRATSMIDFTIPPMTQEDINQVALIHQSVFHRQLLSSEWITCNFQAYPRIRYFVAKNNDNNVIGYIQWTEKSGFRKEVILELEQIAVDKDHQKQGIGAALITQSLSFIEQELIQRDAHIKSILVSTRTDNQAQELYKKVLNAQPVAVIQNLFSADEVFMVAQYPLGER